MFGLSVLCIMLTYIDVVYKMLVICLTALLFLPTTTGTVYTVLPDDHYYPNTTCHHCHNLQHYLLNAIKYFASNTQLLFLPGLHHLHTDLIIQNVHNISLIGNSTTNVPGATPDVSIRCTHNRGIVFVNVSNLKVTNMKINDCMSQYRDDTMSEIYAGGTVMIMQCTDVVLQWLHIYSLKDHFPVITSLMTVNLLGNSYFSHITCSGMIYLLYNNSREEVNKSFLLIDHYHQKIHNYVLLQSLILYVHLTSYMVVLQLSDIKVVKEECEDCQFYFSVDASAINLTSIFFENFHFVYNHKAAALLQLKNSRVWFKKCQFSNNTIMKGLITMNNTVASFSHCVFLNNSNTKALQIKFGLIKLNSVEFSYNRDYRKRMTFLDLSNTVLLLENKVVFKSNKMPTSIIALKASSVLKILNSGIIEFSENKALNIISFSYNVGGEFIQLAEKCSIMFVGNYVCSILGITPLSYPFCIFQYYGATKLHHQQQRNYSVVFFSNHYFNSKLCYTYMPIADCRWLPNSLFTKILPVVVNSQYITYINNFSTNHSEIMLQRYDLCLCKGRTRPDCSISKLGYFYPGQTLELYIYYKSSGQNSIKVKITLESDIDQLYISPCVVTTGEILQTVEENACTSVNYTLGYSTNGKCGLFLKDILESNDHIRLFYVEQFACPFGFVKNNGVCVCHPQLVKVGITNCNINDQTILRPANSWISATSHNDSHTYHTSLQCPFHYCLPHPSYLNLSTPNSQCQFNRSGILCGHCQQGLSVMFASSQCKHCSSIYMFLVALIAIAGLLLVLMLFILNLTVTDGTINAIVLYVNITGINDSVLFQNFTPIYTFTSLANLDLGIQTCFYSGMDDYAKMWLQLAFPFYLIFIATSLIITSRYSTKIQRLTARRALPVLATLFLLSYTKILHTVSSVLFSYSIITQLPSEQSTLVWSVDANVPLLGVRFIILFITCLVIFLIQMPFTIILLFSRPLRRYRYINNFKPLLDAYQGPYKDDHYYWTGVQLLMRAVFLGISTLDKKTNLMIGTIIIGIMCVVTGITHPFKTKLLNYHELILLLNLQVLHILVQNSSSLATINIVIAMAVVHCTLIMTYHIITYMCGGVIKNKIEQGEKSIMGWITSRHKSTVQSFQLDNVPEVRFNYREYREPLVALD